MNIEKAWQNLDDVVSILQSSIKSFHDGDSSAYKSTSVQLRILLCNTRTNNALLPRVAQQVKFHPLWNYLEKELNDGIVFKMPAMVSPKGRGGPETARFFDQTKTPIELEEWLDQALFSSEITIRKLITIVAGKLGVHSDPNYGKELELLKSIRLVDKEAHIKSIVVIGEYILEQIRIALEGNASESGET